MIIRWIVVDGIDGSGKNTIARMIGDHYCERGERVFMVAHPSDGRFGKISRIALQGTGRAMEVTATIFYVFDVLSSVSRLRRLEGKYQTVIFVRYLMGTAYLPETLAPKAYDFFSKLLPVPRRLLLVDIDPGVAMERISGRDKRWEMFENLESLVKVRGNVLKLASDEWDVVENSGDLEATYSSVMEVIDRWDLEEDCATGPS